MNLNSLLLDDIKKTVNCKQKELDDYDQQIRSLSIKRKKTYELIEEYKKLVNGRDYEIENTVAPQKKTRNSHRVEFSKDLLSVLNEFGRRKDLSGNTHGLMVEEIKKCLEKKGIEVSINTVKDRLESLIGSGKAKQINEEAKRGKRYVAVSTSEALEQQKKIEQFSPIST